MVSVPLLFANAYAFSLEDLVVYYKFNESSGDLINLCSLYGGTNCMPNAKSDGTLDGVTQSNTTSVFGTSYYLDGINDKITTTTSRTEWAFMGNGTDWTWVGWVYDGNVAVNQVIFADWSTSGNIGTGAMNYHHASDWFAMQGATTYQFNFFSAHSHTFENWHFMVKQYNASSATVSYLGDVNNTGFSTFANGSMATTGDTPVSMQFGELPSFQIWNHKGNFDEWSFWTRMLTEAELDELWNSGDGLELVSDISTPTGLTATEFNAFQIDLDWTHGLDGGTDGFRIYRNDGTGYVTHVSDTGNTDTDYSDSVSCGTEYSYKVQALSPFNTSANSTEASETTACGAGVVDFLHLRVNEPTFDRMGGVYQFTCPVGEFVTGINSTGHLVCATP